MKKPIGPASFPRILSSKEALAWAFYDWANSAFAITVISGFFPLFFDYYWAADLKGEESTFYLGLINSLASLAVALFAPFLGTIADHRGKKKEFLLVFALLGISMTAGLWQLGEGKWIWAMGIYGLASIGFAGGNVFYDALLMKVARADQVDRVSSMGYAAGYLGSGILFALQVAMYQYPSFFGLADRVQAVKFSFLTVSLWWAVFSLPLFFFVKEKPATPSSFSFFQLAAMGWRSVVATFRDFKRYRMAGIFLLGYYFYIDGVHTIIRMAVKYASSLGIEPSSMITALLMVQWVAFPATFFYYRFAVVIGIQRGILIAIFGYILITCLGYFMQNETHFFILALGIGLIQGGIQALSRSFYSRLIPAGKEAQFFGFYNTVGKSASIIGPVIMGGISVLSGNERLGILSVIVLLVIGAFFVLRIKIPE